MSVLLISFSGREEPGNCVGVLEYISDRLDEDEVDNSLIEITDYEIQSCYHCSYECFSSRCPKNDDVVELYEEIMKYDSVIFAVPVYSGAPCSKYFAFRERSQCVFDGKSYERYKDVDKNYIIVGNEEAGGGDAVNIVEMLEDDLDEIFLLQSHKYGENSISGNIIELEDVREDLDKFLLRINKV